MIAALLSLWDLTVRHVQQLEEHADNWGLIKPNHILIYCCYTKEYNVQSLPTVPPPPTMTSRANPKFQIRVICTES